MEEKGKLFLVVECQLKNLERMMEIAKLLFGEHHSTSSDNNQD